jgi:hypothetical protein
LLSQAPTLGWLDNKPGIIDALSDSTVKFLEATQSQTALILVSVQLNYTQEKFFEDPKSQLSRSQNYICAIPPRNKMPVHQVSHSFPASLFMT